MPLSCTDCATTLQEQRWKAQVAQHNVKDASQTDWTRQSDAPDLFDRDNLFKSFDYIRCKLYYELIHVYFRLYYFVLPFQGELKMYI